VVILNDDDIMDTCYTVGEGATVDVRRDTKEAVTRLLFSYYLWNLSYPKQYQFLGFIQQCMLEDKRYRFHMSGNYLKSVKKYEDTMKEYM
jgi:hypothetical protein